MKKLYSEKLNITILVPDEQLIENENAKTIIITENKDQKVNWLLLYRDGWSIEDVVEKEELFTDASVKATLTAKDVVKTLIDNKRLSGEEAVALMEAITGKVEIVEKQIPYVPNTTPYPWWSTSPMMKDESNQIK